MAEACRRVTVLYQGLIEVVGTSRTDQADFSDIPWHQGMPVLLWCASITGPKPHAWSTV